MDVWKRLKPGRYEIKKGESLFSIAECLRNNRQTPVNLVINKVRTNEDLAALLAKILKLIQLKLFEFINNDDSLAKVDVNYKHLMTIVIPNTYTLFWNTSTGKIFRRLKSEKDNFGKKMTGEEKQKTWFYSNQVYTIASIVEEETNKQDEKGNVASVYINRL